MSIQDANRSRRLALAALLALVNGQPTSELIQEAVKRFRVSPRTVEDGLADLEWGGYIERVPRGSGDRRIHHIWITDKGCGALHDFDLGLDLATLPYRHRQFLKVLADPLHPATILAKTESFRREFRE